MISLKITEEFLYTSSGSIAVRFCNRTLFRSMQMPNPHLSKNFRIMISKTAACRLQMDQETYHLSRGDILIFSGNDSCTFLESNVNAVFYIIDVDPSAVREMLPRNSLCEELDFFFSHADPFSHLLNHENPIAAQLSGYARETEQVLSTKNPGYELQVLIPLLQIFLCILRQTGYCNVTARTKAAKKSGKQHQALKKAVDYIDSHLSEELTLEKLSIISDISPNYLSNIFREQTGSRLWDYISEKRIVLATQLLIDNPNDSVISIALRCGFNNCPNFNRAFKKYTGQTPKAYKNSMIRQED